MKSSVYSSTPEPTLFFSSFLFLSLSIFQRLTMGTSVHENVGRGGTRRSWRAAATTNTTQEAEEDVLQVSKGKGVYGPPLPQDASDFRTFSSWKRKSVSGARREGRAKTGSLPLWRRRAWGGGREIGSVSIVGGGDTYKFSISKIIHTTMEPARVATRAAPGRPPPGSQGRAGCQERWRPECL